MCGGNPERDRARIEHNRRVGQFKMDSAKYWNSETSYVRAEDKAMMGYSRTTGDIESAMRDAIGASRLAMAQNAAKYATTRKISDEGGRSTRAGRNNYLSMLNQQASIETQLRNFTGKKAARAQIGAQRQLASVRAGNVEKLGLPPEFGPPTQYRRRSFFEKFIQPVVGFASQVAGIAAPFAKSDIRLKENIEEVGKSNNGYKIYEWNYITQPNTRYRGAIAQDVVKTNPMAVTIMDDGYLGVYYDKIDVDMEVVS